MRYGFLTLSCFLISTTTCGGLTSLPPVLPESLQELYVSHCGGLTSLSPELPASLQTLHADVYDFVELRRNTGADTERTRDLFLALVTRGLGAGVAAHSLGRSVMLSVVEPGLTGPKYMVRPRRTTQICRNAKSAEI